MSENTFNLKADCFITNFQIHQKMLIEPRNVQSSRVGIHTAGVSSSHTSSMLNSVVQCADSLPSITHWILLGRQNIVVYSLLKTCLHDSLYYMRFSVAFHNQYYHYL